MKAIAELTDGELCMLEQICYLDTVVADAAGASSFAGITDRDAGLTLEEILAGFDENALSELRNLGDTEVGGSCISGKEWADILGYVKGSRLKDLVVRDTLTGENGISLAITYEQEGRTDRAVVAFKGTTGGGEWADNIGGMNAADTPAQQDALLYIEEQPYEHLTVTGHSKGANKAMYVSLLSPRADRCVAFDGQGFSDRFIDRYSAEIQERADRIRSYSLETDFVHILLYPVPGSRQLFCRGFGVENTKQNHSPNSFFQTDAEGNLVTDGAGQPVIVTAVGGQAVREDPSMTVLHRFSSFLMNNASDADREEIVGYLEAVIPHVMSKEDADIRKDTILRITGENTEAVAAVLAWLAVYMQQYQYGPDTVDRILQTLGLETLDEMFGISLPGGAHAGLSTVLDVLIDRLVNGRQDRDIQGLLAYADLAVTGMTGRSVHLAEIWKAADRKTAEISGSGGAGDKQAGSCRIRDFSEGAWERLENDLRRSAVPEALSASGWTGYAAEPWFESIRAGAVMRGLNLYAAAAGETAGLSRCQAQQIFARVNAIDMKYAARLQEETGELHRIRAALEGIGNG